MIKPEDYLSIPEMEAMGYVPTWGRDIGETRRKPEPSNMDVRRGSAPSNVVVVDFSRKIVAK